MRERVKPGYVKAQLHGGRYGYIDTRTWKEVSSAEAIGAVAESARTTDLNESATTDRLVDAYREMGLSKKEAKLAAQSHKGTQLSESSENQLRDGFRALGLTRKQAKLAAQQRS